MKTSSPVLFELIKSLTSSEKRYLKLGLTEKTPEHLKLFDAIVQQETYDEDHLRTQYRGTPFVKNLPVYKAYLYDFILKKLAQFHENSESARVFECLRFAELLMEKKLVDQAAKQLRKAEKLARKFELPDMMLLVSRMQQEILTQGNRLGFDQSHKLYQLRQSALDELEAHNEFSRLFNEISSLQIRMQKASQLADIKALEQWKEQPLLQTPEERLSVANRVLLLKSLAIYHFTRNQPREASHYNQRILNLLESETAFNKKHPEQYLSTLNNFIIDQLTLRNIPAFEQGLQRLEKVPDNPAFAKVKNIKVRMFHQRYLLFFNYCFAARDYQKALADMAGFEKGLKVYENRLKFHQRLTLNYLAGVLHFGAGQYTEAQRWLIPILQESKADVVPEIFRYARMLNLLVHFQLEHWDYLDSLLPSTQRALVKMGNVNQSEKLLLQFLKKASTVPTRKAMADYTQTLKGSLATVADQPGERRLREYIPLEEWLDGLL